MTYRRIDFIFLLCSILYLVGCTPEKMKISRTLDNIYDSKMDLGKVVGKGMKISRIDFKKGYAQCLLVSETDPPSSYFALINLSTKKIEHLVKNTFGEYYSMSFDVYGDTLFCVSGLNAKKIYRVNLRANRVYERNFEYNSPLSPGVLFAFSKYNFLGESVYGSVVVISDASLANVYKNRSLTNKNAISFPLSESRNLICGQHFREDSTNLIAVNNLGNEVWRRAIKIHPPLNNSGAIDLIRTSQNYVIRDGPEIQALNVSTGKQRWVREFKMYTDKAVLFDGNVLLMTLENEGRYPSSQDFKQRVLLRFINATNGSDIWKSEIDVQGDVRLSIHNKNIMLFANNSIDILDSNGKRTVVKSECSSCNTIDIKYDPFADKHYLIFDGIVYW